MTIQHKGLGDTPQLVNVTGVDTISLDKSNAARLYVMVESAAGSGTITVTARPHGGAGFVAIEDAVLSLADSTHSFYVDGAVAELKFTPSAGQTYSAGVTY